MMDKRMLSQQFCGTDEGSKAMFKFCLCLVFKYDKIQEDWWQHHKQKKAGKSLEILNSALCYISDQCASILYAHHETHPEILYDWLTPEEVNERMNSKREMMQSMW